MAFSSRCTEIDMRSPIQWMGGKARTVKKLLPLIPPHHTYIEPYGGGASLLFAKEPSSVEVYNDINLLIYNFFRVLRSPDFFPRFYNGVVNTPYHRYEYRTCVEELRRIDGSYLGEHIDPEAARMFYCVARQSFGGDFGRSWASDTKKSRGGMGGQVSSYITALHALPAIHGRLLEVQCECRDGLDIIDRYDSEESFFYVDPPYMAETRKPGHDYDYEMTDEEHMKLLEKLNGIKGKYLLSGYFNDMYSENLQYRGYIAWETSVHAAGRTRNTGIHGEGAAKEQQSRTECVWYNYDISPSVIRKMRRDFTDDSSTMSSD